MRIEIFVGTGGVGKTSVAAASALKAAIAGKRCLVLTIDPARRLQTALGIDSAALKQRVPLDVPAGRGELWAAILDVRTSLDQAVLRYAKPKDAKAILEHPVYQLLITSLAGMQELMAIERIHQSLGEGIECLVIDTAPSRHALEFLDKPEFFTHLVSMPIVKLVGRTYKLWLASPLHLISKMSFELYTRVEEILGTKLVHQVLEFFSIFRKIAEGYADRARQTLKLLKDPETTSFNIVTTPFKALRDGEYFLTELTRRKFLVGSLVINRVWPDFPETLPAESASQLQELVGWYHSVCESHQRVWTEASRRFSGQIPKLIRLPELPRDVDGLPALYAIVQKLDQ